MGSLKGQTQGRLLNRKEVFITREDAKYNHYMNLIEVLKLESRKLKCS